MKPGLHNITDEEYFAVEAASNSGLKHIKRSPAHFIADKKKPRVPTPSMLAGSALHCATLEPTEFEKRYKVLPPDAPRKPTVAQLNSPKPSDKARFSIDWWASWDMNSQGAILLAPEKYDEYRKIGDLIRNHPELKPLLATGKAEHAVIANDPVTGVLCKCKPDHIACINGLNVVIELKSTDDAQPYWFQRTAYNFSYFTAAAFYQDVMEWSIGAPDLYLMVAFERDPPHGIKIYEVPEYDIERGRRLYREPLNVYAYCMDTGDWPCYDTTIETLEFPHWAKD